MSERRSTHKTIRSTAYDSKGNVTRDNKEDFDNNGSTIYSADGKRILWTNRKDMK
jgi:hypothetical protein